MADAQQDGEVEAFRAKRVQTLKEQMLSHAELARARAVELLCIASVDDDRDVASYAATLLYDVASSVERSLGRKP